MALASFQDKLDLLEIKCHRRAKRLKSILAKL
jgi:hypothetical protein